MCDVTLLCVELQYVWRYSFTYAQVSYMTSFIHMWCFIRHYSFTYAQVSYMTLCMICGVLYAIICWYAVLYNSIIICIMSRIIISRVFMSLIHKSCHSYSWVMSISILSMCPVTLLMSHVILTNESCHSSCHSLTNHVTLIHETCQSCQNVLSLCSWVMSFLPMSHVTHHVTHITESYHQMSFIMSHHVTHMISSDDMTHWYEWHDQTQWYDSVIWV